jgi:uncharacterized protein (TIGR00369 family)
MSDLDPAHQRSLIDEFVGGFAGYCGFTLTRIRRGYVESRLEIRPEHRNTDSAIIHGGVLATLADHTSGCAGYSTVPLGTRLATLSFTIHFLRAALGTELACRAWVVKPGKTIIVVDAEVEAGHEGSRTPVSRATVTLIAAQGHARLRDEAAAPAIPLRSNEGLG